MSELNHNDGEAVPETTQHSVVDRNVVAVFATDDNEHLATPSPLSPSTERLYRLHGTGLILSSTKLLKQSASTYATACTIFHRFFHRVSLKQYDVWSAAMASTLLAGKIEEEPRPIRHIVVIYSHLYRRSRLICHQDDQVSDLLRNPRVAAVHRATKLTLEEKQTILRHVQPMSPLGPVYEEWHKALLEMEQTILRQLGFTIYWIPDSHPHKFILYFVRILEMDDQEFTQHAWKYCNDSCRLDLCVRFEPELIACAAIHMAACDSNITLPRSWWNVFVGSDSELGLSTLCNALAGLRNPNEKDVAIGNLAFLRSLSGESFNGPESYLWASSGAEARSL